MLDEDDGSQYLEANSEVKNSETECDANNSIPMRVAVEVENDTKTENEEKK